MTACCGFGHRDVLEKIDDAVYAAVLKAAEQGCDIFYTGAMGEFDSLFSSAVRKVKKTYPEITLFCVKPYFTNDLNIRACSESPRVRMAPSDFSPDDAKTAGNTLCINEDFGKIWRKRCRLPKEACQTCVERF